MARFSISTAVLTASALLSPGGAAQTSPPIMDMGAAIEYCDRSPLRPPEGVWEFPDDRTNVLIKSSPASPYKYDIIAVSTPDCGIKPGEKIGELEESGVNGKFRLSLFGNRKGGLLTDMRHCSAEADADFNSIRIHPRKFKISLRSIRLLPKFWQLFRIRVSDPESSLPVGLVRRYPAPDCNGLALPAPRYL